MLTPTLRWWSCRKAQRLLLTLPTSTPTWVTAAAAPLDRAMVPLNTPPQNSQTVEGGLPGKVAT
jgi:hypothetical protein